MKTVLVFSILFCMSVLPALAELTDADLDKIRLIVNESLKAEIATVRTEIATVRTEIATVKQELKSEIATVKQELKSEIATVRQELKSEITNSEKRVKDHINLNIQNVEKRLTTYNWVIYVLTPLIVAAIGIPTTIMAWRSMKDSNQEKKIQELTQEIETLKQILNP